MHNFLRLRQIRIIHLYPNRCLLEMAFENNHQLDKREELHPQEDVFCLAGGLLNESIICQGDHFYFYRTKRGYLLLLFLTRFRPAKLYRKWVRPLFQQTVLSPTVHLFSIAESLGTILKSQECGQMTQQGVQLTLPLLLLTQFSHNLENQAMYLVVMGTPGGTAHYSCQFVT